MPDFKEGSGYKQKPIDFGEGTGGSGMGGVHKTNIENKNIKAEIGNKPVDHLQNATPEEQAHNDAADKSEGSIPKQTKRRKRREKKEHKAFLKSQREEPVRNRDKR